MARINLSAEEHARLPEALRARAAQAEDGGFLLEHEIAEGQSLTFESVSGLKSALEKERQQARAAAERLRSFDGLEADKAREALKKLDEMANWNPEEQVRQRIDAQLGQMRDKHAQELKTRDDKLGQVTGQLEGMLIERAAREAIEKAGGSQALLLPHVRSQVRMRDNNGQLIAEVFDPSNGAPRVGDGAGNPMTIPGLVDELKAKPEYAPAFNGTGHSGSGAVGGGRSAKAAPPAGQRAGVKVIAGSDIEAINANLDGIADGTVEVNMDA